MPYILAALLLGGIATAILLWPFGVLATVVGTPFGASAAAGVVALVRASYILLRYRFRPAKTGTLGENAPAKSR
jgi:hypothetical protein